MSLPMLRPRDSSFPGTNRSEIDIFCHWSRGGWGLPGWSLWTDYMSCSYNLTPGYKVSCEKQISNGCVLFDYQYLILLYYVFPWVKDSHRPSNISAIRIESQVNTANNSPHSLAQNKNNTIIILAIQATSPVQILRGAYRKILLGFLHSIKNDKRIVDQGVCVGEDASHYFSHPLSPNSQ